MGELVRLCCYLGCQYGCSDCHWKKGEDGDQPVDRLGQLCQHAHCPGPDVQLNGLDQLQLQRHSLHLRHGNALHPLNLESPCSSCPCPTSLLTGLTLDLEKFSKQDDFNFFSNNNQIYNKKDKKYNQYFCFKVCHPIFVQNQGGEKVIWPKVSVS